jgi:L-alanine-DL-glutamate epimerase-like enolase superfamily enzyme
MSAASVLRVRELRITPLSIPMRLKFEHAAAARNVADPVLVQAIAGPPFDGLSGWGETLARPYVTGETAGTVIRDIESVLVPQVACFAPNSFDESVPILDALPFEHDGRCIHAARAAVELALLDLACRAWGRRPSDAARVFQFKHVKPIGRANYVRYSGIIVGKAPWKVALLARAQRAYGLADFKIKVAVDGWEQRLAIATRVLGLHNATLRPCTLRADANSGWSLEQALTAIPGLEQAGVCALEQPLSREHDAQLADLARATRLSLIADESLISLADAERLMDLGVRVLNIRIAKQGGLLPSWRMAEAAFQRRCDVQLGCLVGETSILTAAGAAFLDAVPSVRFAEGAFGRWLLHRDVTSKPLQFGFGGCVKPRRAPGWGVEVDENRVSQLAIRSESRHIAW